MATQTSPPSVGREYHPAGVCRYVFTLSILSLACGHDSRTAAGGSGSSAAGSSAGSALAPPAGGTGATGVGSPAGADRSDPAANGVVPDLVPAPEDATLGVTLALAALGGASG